MVANTKWSPVENSTIIRICKNPGSATAQEMADAVNEALENKHHDRTFSAIQTQVYVITREMLELNSDWVELEVPEVLRKASAKEKLENSEKKQKRELDAIQSRITSDLLIRDQIIREVFEVQNTADREWKEWAISRRMKDECDMK